TDMNNRRQPFQADSSANQDYRGEPDQQRPPEADAASEKITDVFPDVAAEKQVIRHQHGLEKLVHEIVDEFHHLKGKGGKEVKLQAERRGKEQQGYYQGEERLACHGDIGRNKPLDANGNSGKQSPCNSQYKQGEQRNTRPLRRQAADTDGSGQQAGKRSCSGRHGHIRFFALPRDALAAAAGDPVKRRQRNNPQAEEAHPDQRLDSTGGDFTLEKGKEEITAGKATDKAACAADQQPGAPSGKIPRQSSHNSTPGKQKRHELQRRHHLPARSS